MKPNSTRRDFIGSAALAGAGLGLGLKAALGATPPVGHDGKYHDDPIAEAEQLIQLQTASGVVTAAALLVRQGPFAHVRGYGHAEADTPFLIASPSKPITASAVLLLRDQRQLQLFDPVQKFLPQFKGGQRARVTIQHLLTHTSGLPDMLPENVALRQRHAPLSEFVAGTCQTDLLFEPGAKVSYQSMGLLLAAAIVEKISAQPLPAFLAANVFGPLRMTKTSLALGGRKISETARCQVPEPSDWDWNSPYWRNLGAPWGGVHSTVHDLATFIEQFTAPGSSLLREETCREMRTIHTGALEPAWGLGWMRQRGTFGTGCSAATFGHYGSTGTVVWRDPEADLTCVLLTTRPAADSRAGLLGPVSDLVARRSRG